MWKPTLVRITGVTGRPATPTYKALLAHHAGWSGEARAAFAWPDAREKAEAAVRATLRDDKLASIDQIEVRTEDLTTSGRLRFAADGKSIENAVLPRVAFGDTDVRITASRNPKGAYVIREIGRAHV